MSSFADSQHCNNDQIDWSEKIQYTVRLPLRPALRHESESQYLERLNARVRERSEVHHEGRQREERFRAAKVTERLHAHIHRAAEAVDPTRVAVPVVAKLGCLSNCLIRSSALSFQILCGHPYSLHSLAFPQLWDCSQLEWHLPEADGCLYCIHVPQILYRLALIAALVFH